jgi:predicted N-acyltransferase
MFVKTSRSIAEIDPHLWDSLSNGRPFQSYCWYLYGERVTADCAPFYIIITEDGKPAARGTFSLVHNEPLPVPAIVRAPLQGLLQRWPLFICRTPLANLSGLLLPDGPDCEPVRRLLAESALQEARRNHASFLLWDYTQSCEAHAAGWPRGFTPLSIPDPGTFLSNKWDSFDAYLAAGNKKDRQHYKRSLREAEKLGIHVERRRSVSNVEEFLPLIRNVERKFGAAPNPWVHGMIEHMEMVESTFLEARIGERPVGCGLLLYDNGAQMAAALGLEKDVPYVYFALVYESMREAFEKKVCLLRWGSGAYEVKAQLGFQSEQNNHLVVAGTRPLTQRLIRLAVRS